MAENDLTVLVIEAQSVRGVRVTRQRDALSQVADGVWPIAAAPADAAVAEGVAADEESRLAQALAAAGAALGVPGRLVVALPTDRLMVRVLSLPPADAASLAGIVRLQMEKIAPFSGEELTVASEVLRADDAGVRVLAAAAPRPLLDLLEAALAKAGFKPDRLDVALSGWWRQCVDSKLFPACAGRQAVFFEQGGLWDLLIADDGVPVLARSLGTSAEAVDLARELTLSLLAAEFDAGAAPLQTLRLVSEQASDESWARALEAVAGGLPLEHLDRRRLGAAGLGVARRALEKGPLDLMPDAWRQREVAQQTRKRFLTGLGAAAALWLMLAAGLLLAPLGVKSVAARVAARAAACEPAYRTVADTRSRVRLIRTYMDRSRSLLENLRGACDILPEGIDLGSLTYRREEGVKFTGDAADPALVYQFKDALDASKVFTNSMLNGPTLDAARRRHRFEIEAAFPREAE